MIEVENLTNGLTLTFELDRIVEAIETAGARQQAQHVAIAF
ncbi:hypothetical protein ACFXBB_35530 [Streptomyces scopuliridis]